MEDARSFQQGPRCIFVPLPVSVQNQVTPEPMSLHLREPQPVLPPRQLHPGSEAKVCPASPPRASGHHQVPSWGTAQQFILKTHND